MRGFRRRTDLADAQAWADARPAPQDVETVPLEDAAGRTLAADLVSTVDVPAFARAAMDGWAVRGEDTFGASETDPLPLRVVGRALAGRGTGVAVRRGEAVRIMTGAPLPEGADAVLPAEEGEESDGILHARAPAPPARHVGQVGEDVRAGATLLGAGRRLRPQDLGLAASIGRGALPVRRAPRVFVIVTGDEILPPGAPPEGARIPDANGPMLAALVRRDGGVATLVRVADDRTAVASALTGADADVVLVSGGSSVGEEDHAPALVARHGTLAFHGVAMRPASPAGAGEVGGRPVFLLPGNPVSCLAAYDLLAGRVVRRFAGRAPDLPYRAEVLRLGGKIASALGRVDYVRVRVDGDAAVPLMSRGASILSSTTEADGFVLVPRDGEGWPAGAEVTVWRYDAD